MMLLRLCMMAAVCLVVCFVCFEPSLAAASSVSSSTPAPTRAPSSPRPSQSTSSLLPSLSPLTAIVSSVLSLLPLSASPASSPAAAALSASAVPLSSPTVSPVGSESSGSFDYATAAPAPSYLPSARLRCALQVVDGGSHRSVLLELGSPAQSLRLLLDTGSSDLLALNASYCAHSPSVSRSCFNPSVSSSPQSPTVVSSAPFVLPAYVDDGEVLSDSSAHAALALANLPVQLVGSNLSLLLGATDVTMQDALLGYPSAASRQVSFVLSNPQSVFVPPIPFVDFPYSVSAVNSLSDVDGLLGLSYGPLSALAQLDASTYSSAFLAITQATQIQSQSATFALDFSDNTAFIGGIDGHCEHQHTHEADGETVQRPELSRCHYLIARSLALRVCVDCVCAEKYRDSLQWSYGAAFGLDDYHSFSMWDLSVCGANLQQGVLQGVAPMSAIVDTGSTCLSLPAELFDALVSWLPITCSDSTDGTQQGQSTATAVEPSLLGGNVGDPVSSGSAPTYAADPGSASNINQHVRYCWLAADLLSGTLPTVSFRMAQSNPSLADDDPLQPPKLYVPLADLIIGTARTSATSAVEPQR